MPKHISETLLSACGCHTALVVHANICQVAVQRLQLPIQMGSTQYFLNIGYLESLCLAALCREFKILKWSVISDIFPKSPITTSLSWVLRFGTHWSINAAPLLSKREFSYFDFWSNRRIYKNILDSHWKRDIRILSYKLSFIMDWVGFFFFF